MLSTYIDEIVKRLVGPGKSNRTARETLSAIVKALAKYDELFERFLEYAEDSARRDFSVGPQCFTHEPELMRKSVNVILKSSMRRGSRYGCSASAFRDVRSIGTRT